MLKKCLSLILVSFLLVPSVANAKSMFEESFEREQRELKSEGLAFTMSLAASTIPVVMGGAFLSERSGNEVRVNGRLALSLASTGIILGPSTGHFYAGQTGRGIKGVAIRSGILAGTIGIAYMATTGGHSDVKDLIAYGAFIIGGIISSLHGIYDICTTPSSVRKYNESLLEENSLILVPEINLVDESYGLSVVYKF